MNTTELKTKIRAHLAKAGEATAKQIAKAIGNEDYPIDVVSALSEMRADAEVECDKKKGKGNELWYWLTKVEAEAAPTDKECCNAARVVATTAGSEVASLRAELESLQYQIKLRKTCQEADAERIKEQQQRIADLEAKLGHANLHIGALQEQLQASEDSASTNTAARGYLVCAPKRKPAKVTKAESAVARAKSAAKAAGRCEVFALVPVGVATRKQIKAVEFKDAKAA